MESKFHYTNERNVQIVIALLKAHGIHRVIASPGTTNMTFVVSIQNDPWFQVWSSVDERSAAYLACGMAAETGEPVVISCTGATASRNYMPGLTEAYYRKLPVLAITSTRGNHRVGHLVDQQIDRRKVPNDIVVESVTIPMVKDEEDERMCEIEANKAILALSLNGGGPSHINLYTKYSKDFSTKILPPAHPIYRHTGNGDFPEIAKDAKVCVFIGSHQMCSNDLTNEIEKFCESYNAVVFKELTSGYNGNYSVVFNSAFSQKGQDLRKVDLCILIGEVNSGLFRPDAREVWRISEDGKLRDPWNNLKRVFMMPEISFFKHYQKKVAFQMTYYQECTEELEKIDKLCPELPFGNIWIARHSHNMLPLNSVLHLGIFNSLRSWSYVNLDRSIETRCNVGGFGIDGGVSTLVGSSFACPKKLHFGVFGDLAFFYDLNVMANRHIGNNIRIMLINNGIGAEFRNYNHPCSFLGEEANKFVAASGHFGNKSQSLIKHYAEDLGYKYLSASSKEEYASLCEEFFSSKSYDYPIILEVFTNCEEESAALEIVQTFMKDNEPRSIKERVKEVMKRVGVSAMLNRN